MEDQFLNLMDVLSKPAIIETFVDILFSSLPFWLPVLIGLVIGWCWKPRWTDLVCLAIRARLRYLWTFPPLFGAHRLCLAFTAFSALSLVTRLFSNFRLMTRRNSTQSPPTVDGTVTEDAIVNENDLEHFLHLLNGKGREMTWKNLMDRSTSNMAYQAWRHEPETGPMICRSRTIFEDATPELVRDFFWDDEFQPKWDPMLAYFKLVEECPRTGTTIVHWIKKFPFFCSDREYIIGRRIWEAGKTGVPYPDLMKRDNPRRVDKYFSSLVIRPVQSRKSDGQTACEVVLIHYEDMGIPKDVTKLGVRLRMWGTVKKLHDGFRAYQLARNSDAPLSRSALLARIATKISFQGNSASSETVSDDIEQFGGIDVERHIIDWKWVVIAGTVVIAGLHIGAIVKGLLFGAGQRFGRKRLAAQK